MSLQDVLEARRAIRFGSSISRQLADLRYKRPKRVSFQTTVNGKPEYFEVDAAINEDHDLSAEVTEFPVEKGSIISDHMIIKPDEITISCVFSDTPVSFKSFAGVTIDYYKEADRPSVKRYEWFKDAQANGTLIDVTTTLAVYTDMVIKRVSTKRNVETTNGLVCDVTLKKIVITTAEDADIEVDDKPTSDRVNKPKNKGKVSKSAASKKTQRSSWFIDAGGGKLLDAAGYPNKN